MKKVIFIVSMVSTFACLTAFKSSNSQNVNTFVNSTFIETQYQIGWKEGHCEGWKDVKGKNAYCPSAPYPPYPSYPKSSESYKDGYNDGFKRGMSDARK